MEPIEPKIVNKDGYKKTGKYIVIAGVVFALCILLALMGYWVAHRSETGQWQSTAPTPTAILNANDDIVDWKTYRNEEYGIEFNYPSDWNISDTDYDLGANLAKDITKQEGDLTYMFEFYIFNNPADQVWYKPDRLDNVEYITIDNKISAVKGQEKYEGFPALVSIWTYNSKGYLFSSIPRMAEEPRFKEIFDKILSSFKFIENNKSDDVALNYCRSKSPSNFNENYTGYTKVLSLNFDSDQDKEIAGVCSTGNEADGDKEGLLFVLDLQNGKYEPVLEKEGQMQLQRFYDFKNLEIQDIDKDKIDEIIYEGEGWSMSGGDHWLKLYSPKYQEWFSKTESWSLDESDLTGEKRTEKTIFSANLENSKYQVFKEFLTKQQFTL